MLFAALHMSVVGTKRRTVARHQFGRYRRHSGHAANASGASIRRFLTQLGSSVCIAAIEMIFSIQVGFLTPSPPAERPPPAKTSWQASTSDWAWNTGHGGW
jgi:hypothetical protein